MTRSYKKHSGIESQSRRKRSKEIESKKKERVIKRRERVRGKCQRGE